MQLSEKEWSKLPPHLQALFRKLPNPGSEEVLAGFPETASGVLAQHHRRNGKSQIGTFDICDRTGEPIQTFGDSGSAARFFFSAKADAHDRLSSKHPTVKPVDLIRWLVRLVTPPGGTVLDCFAGSGTTGMAAMADGFNAVLIERETEYVADIQRRLQHVEGADTPLFQSAPTMPLIDLLDEPETLFGAI